MSTLKYSDFRINPIFTGVMTSQGDKLSHECPPHFHLDYDFTLINSGVLELRVENKILYFSSNQISAINPGSVHSGRSVGKEPLSAKNIRISKSFVNEIARVNHSDFIFPATFSELPIFNCDIVNLFEKYFDMSRDDNSHPQDVFETGWHLFNSLVDLSNDVVSKGEEERIRLNESLEVMDRLVYGKIKIADVAKAVNLSECHFIRKFKRTFGLTPYRYFMQMKLEKAFNELVKGKKVNEVAAQYGYSDQSHLNRLIKKHYGYTPQRVKSIGV